MGEKVQRIINIINEIASPKLAEPWDNVGLLVGDYTAEIDKVMVTLDITEPVLDEAIAQNVQLIISHHPVIFKELKSIRADQPVGRLVIKAIQHGINIFCAHTNLDIAEGGINDLLAEKLGLLKVEPLIETNHEQLFKLVVYVPSGYEEMVRNAISDAGAGWIGNYSHCTFQVAGLGTFKPLSGTNPFIGKIGEVEKVEEIRLESVVPVKKIKRVLNAMLKAHPYEEVAYDLYPIANEIKAGFGLGRIGYLSDQIVFEELVQKVKTVLNTPYLRYTGNLGLKVKKVAICGGKGGSYISKAAFSGADVYLTGEVDYHDAHLAQSLGLALIEAGHYYTEAIMVPYIISILEGAIAKESLSIELISSKINTDPMSLYK